MIAEKTASTRIKSMHKKIQEIRMSEERGVKYMQKWEEIVALLEEKTDEVD